MTRPRLSLFLSASVLTLSVAACGITTSGALEPAPTPTVTVTVTETPTATPTPTPEPDPVFAFPLTGRETTDEAATLAPSVLVKIDNHPKARPQTGVTEADVVYEELVEGGATRLMIILQSRLPEVVGPIRSARLVDALIAPAHAAVFAYSGARDDVNVTLRRAGLALLVDDDDGFPFYRGRHRQAPNNLYADANVLLEQGRNKQGVAETTAPAFLFDAELPANPAGCPKPVDVSISGRVDGEKIDETCFRDGMRTTFNMSKYARIVWEWDAEVEGFRRFFNEVEQGSEVPDVELVLDNVVLMGMQVGAGGCCDVTGASFTHTDAIGEGEAIVLRDGVAIPALWSKPDAATHYSFTTRDGTPLPLDVGSTWMHLMPRGNLPG